MTASLARQVILFVVDGLRPDALREADTPQIDVLIARGAYTWQAQAVTPSVSLPCHLSLFFAVPPLLHGVVSNEWARPEVPIPSLIEVVHSAGLGTAAFYSWEELRDLAKPGALDFVYYHRLGDPEGDRDLEIGEAAADYLSEHSPALTFVYLGATDAVGHRHGWMSGPYLQAISKADRAVGLVLNGLRASGHLAEVVCLILADHGGHDFDHNAGLAADLTIPWIICGPGIRRGHQLASPVSIIDTAPTIVHILGLSTPDVWSGKVVLEALASR